LSSQAAVAVEVQTIVVFQVAVVAAAELSLQQTFP
jgi:hypothetical protein